MPKSSSSNVAICTIVDAQQVSLWYTLVQTKRIEVSLTLSVPKFSPILVAPFASLQIKGKFLKHYHISHVTSSTGHPQSNGMVERRQQMLISYFKKLIHSPATQSHWDEALPDFQTIINSTGSASRKHSPFFLTFFRHPHFPFQHLSNREHNFDENSSVESRLNLSKPVSYTHLTLPTKA